ncbi:GGDEF domain-containing protein [Methylonatrum kenyense]|uniref:putative bifunctional diguanylate cyclase/phosphodiesterase n=1 Tax=Methylonatrum kenyense TaxID=455253 RepID=UPI0020BFB572|nr:GGDEF domain-containing protein [Methylonatrum kenyense]MCK8516357.1 GGDEF domain-containing protein [Methylonatrum kenyense]
MSSFQQIDEEERLKDLFSLEILDTESEERFDHLAQLTARILRASNVGINLVDRNRQWSKSHVGIPASGKREDSLCSHALNNGYLEVPDTFADSFFKNHPAVVHPPFVRFYAGVVLHGPTGHPVGTLCIFDTEKRRLTESERELLIALGSLVEREMNFDHERVRAREALIDITRRDAETGLPNEKLFIENMKDLILVFDSEERPFALIHLRVDNLDAITRLHGRAMRDRIIAFLSNRLTAADNQTLLAARIGPSRFCAVIPLMSIRSAFDAALPLVNSLREPIEIEGHLVRADLDAGLAVYPEDSRTAEELMECARRALKSPYGIQHIYAFTPESEAHAARQLALEERLESAVIKNKTYLNYQPVFRSSNRDLVGFEALMRWNDEKFGQISPAEFIPIAEKKDRLSRLVTQWVLKTACKEARRWESNYRSATFRIGINIPAREFYQSDFIYLVKSTLADHRVVADRITLELTEESLITDIDHAIDSMQRLSEIGIKLALDDFGTGYSSLSYLRRLPVDLLKLDKNLIDDIPEDKEARSVVSGIFGIAAGLGLRTVAEGVETEEQLQLLQGLGCDLIQGYYLGKPMDADGALNLIESHHAQNSR